ncbi:hypothetical protein D1007_41169 [Hordeum vulgare]|nr:hypothetical protein D1007_41169 [Hordeum vulgare]
MGIYITRWSAKQLCEIANTIKGEKGDVISKSSFMDLLHISPLRPPSEALVDFIVMRIATKKRLLKLNDQKKIPLTRAMVKKIFNVPSRSKPLQFGKRGKADFHEIYLEGERAPIPTTVSILSNDVDDDEDTMERSWILLCLSFILAPGTRNMVPLDYLYNLQDMSVVHEFVWDEHILLDAMREVKKYQDKRNVIYMDHIEFPRGCIVDHTIDYSLPRARFVKEFYFTAVIADDILEDGFRKRPLPPHMHAIFNKHKEIHDAELKGALSSFGSLLEGIRKRMGLMLSEASKAGFWSDEAKHECRDVTFEPKQPDNMEQVATATAQSTVTASFMQQASQPNDTKSVDPGVVVGKKNAARTFHKSESEHNNANDRSNAKGEDICSKANIFEWMWPRSTSYPCVNLIRWPGTLEDGPSFGLSEHGSPDALLFHDVPQVESPPRSPALDIKSFMEIRARGHLFDDLFAAATSPRPVYDVASLMTFPPISTGPGEACVDETREEAVVEVSSGRGHDQKNPTLKRDPPTEPTAAKLPKMKKIKIDEMDDGIYQRFDCGIFAILYMGNLTAKGLNPFNTDTTSLLNFWKYIAAKLFKHPQNTLILEEELEKLLKKS